MKKVSNSNSKSRSRSSSNFKSSSNSKSNSNLKSSSNFSSNSKSRVNSRVNSRSRVNSKSSSKFLKLFIIITFIICCCTFGYSLYNVIKWRVDAKKTDNTLENISTNTLVKDVSPNESQIVESEKPDTKSSSNPYWDYIKMNLIDVNFKELKSKNSDTKGWIKVNGTNINYPFVQTSNNDFYLDHGFNKKSNSAGWVFADYRNEINGNDKNLILYAHARLDGIMFGSLKKILKNNWYNNTNNHIIKLSTEKENTLWQVFSIYHIPVTNDYIQVYFTSDSEYINFLNKLKDRSIFKFDTTLNANSKILTLSSCYDNNERVVMHAKLIKRQAKTN